MVVDSRVLLNVPGSSFIACLQGPLKSPTFTSPLSPHMQQPWWSTARKCDVLRTKISFPPASLFFWFSVKKTMLSLLLGGLKRVHFLFLMTVQSLRYYLPISVWMFPFCSCDTFWRYYQKRANSRSSFRSIYYYTPRLHWKGPGAENIQSEFFAQFNLVQVFSSSHPLEERNMDKPGKKWFPRMTWNRSASEKLLNWILDTIPPPQN